MLTKTDITTLRTELKKDFVTRKEFREIISNFSDQVVELFSITNKKLDKVLLKLDDHNDFLNNHELRIEKVEEKVFAT